MVVCASGATIMLNTNCQQAQHMLDLRDVLIACDAARSPSLTPVHVNTCDCHQGAGVHLASCFEDVRRVAHDNHDIREWVLQRYVGRPLLLRGCKFHLRAYVLAGEYASSSYTALI
jgi:Tubulin-tyrosine ligase family